MKRLVYSPRVDAIIETDSGTYDISRYIVSGEVHRKLNQVSSATLTVRNPQFMWTERSAVDPTSGQKMTAPVFHPMDKITIILTRLKDYPIQVFTGFLDEAPYIATYPGTVTLRASCTLKRLNYTYIDAGLKVFHDFLVAHDWEVNERFGIVSHPSESQKYLVEGQPDNPTARENKQKLNDANFGRLLFDILVEIGGWNPDNIQIDALPDGIERLVANLFEEFKDDSKEAFEQLSAMLKDIIGTAELSGAAAASGTTSGPTSGQFHQKGTRLQKGKTYTVGASTYGWTAGDDTGVDVVDQSLFSGNPAVAELGGAFNMRISGKGPDYNQKVRVCYKGRCTTAYFRDIGSGGGDVKGRPRAIDLHVRVAKAIGFPNSVDLVQITLL